jgi:peroxiredoxin
LSILFSSFYFMTLVLTHLRWLMCLPLCGLLWACTPQTAPESNFVLLDGSQTSTSQLRGKVTLINFWATSCTTCVAEMPQIISTYNQYQSRGFETVAVAMSYDPPSYVVNFAQTRKLPFKVAIDNTGAVAKAWGDIKLTPTTYLVDKRGAIVKRYVGTPDFKELNQLIEKLLAAT